jgi:predicted aspartyl protease
VYKGPTLSVIVANRSATIPVNTHAEALLDTGSEFNLIQDTLAANSVHLMRIDDRLIQTANGSVAVPVYMGQLTIPNLTYTKLVRFVGVDLGADRVVLGREALQDFKLTYSGRSRRVRLEY